jgi:hypothetical protein
MTLTGLCIHGWNSTLCMYVRMYVYSLRVARMLVLSSPIHSWTEARGRGGSMDGAMGLMDGGMDCGPTHNAARYSALRYFYVN